MGTLQVRRWTRQEYDRMVEAGVLAPGERAELIDGEVLAMTPQGSCHATAVRLAEEALRAAFGTGYDIRVQMPLALDPSSEPEPDVAVVRGSPRDYRDAHPTSALLLVEVADTTLGYDRDQKGSLYARAGVAEYWIVNVLDRRVEGAKEPNTMARATPAPAAYSRIRRRTSSGDTGGGPLTTSTWSMRASRPESILKAIPSSTGRGALRLLHTINP